MRAVLSVTLLYISATLSAWSQDMIDYADPQRILEVAKGFGSASLTEDTEGYPFITGRMDGLRYRILFYACEGTANCDVIQFRASWANPGLSVAEVNAWNASKLFGKAYLADDGDLFVEYVTSLAYGVTARNLDDAFEWFSIVLESVGADLLPRSSTPGKG